MRIAFVIQRYGLEVAGGSEAHCRQVVERLAQHYEIEIITTCAKDYWTWENAYPAGTTQVNGITVHRFPTLRPRAADFSQFSARIFGQPHTLQQEYQWLYDQGPVAPELLTYIAAHSHDYAVFIFFTYIYYTAALGLRLVPDRALLIPTAHDEPPIYFDLYKALFHSARGILFNTLEERAFVHSLFGNEYIPHEIVGVGVDVPENRAGDRFRQKYGIDRPYLLYVGRIVSSKGCDELMDYFVRFKAQTATDLQLVLAGHPEMTIPDTADIRYLGYVSDEDKFDAMSGAVAVLSPGRYESLSMIALESWMVERPVICNAASPVVAGLCRRSNGGLYYQNQAEFGEIAQLLLRQPNLQQRLGQNGRRFVAETYAWDIVIEKYVRMIEMVQQHEWQGR
jgi:glycosyltransferase involved in cell wall biosynthesis